MSDKNCFFYPSSLPPNIYIARAIKRFWVANKNKIFHFFINRFNIQLVLLLGNSKLYEKSVAVTKEELPALLPQINSMWENILAIQKTYGFGRAIAAPQIGLAKRIIALNINQPLVLINPVLSGLSDETFELWDDCMSFPNLLVHVKRHKKLTVCFYDIDWEKHTWHLENDMAELIQHEYDHLEGILATQRAINKKSFKWKV